MINRISNIFLEMDFLKIAYGMRKYMTQGVARNTPPQGSRELAADIASRSFKNYDALKSLKNMGVGLGGAIAGFVLDQSVNMYEDGLYLESQTMIASSDIIDSKNNIGVIATEK